MKSSLSRLPALVAALLIAIGPHAFAGVSAQGTPMWLTSKSKMPASRRCCGHCMSPTAIAYRSDVPLDGRVSGTYEGPLSQVIARLLDGTNYVLTKNGSNFRVVIVAGAGSQPMPPAAAMPAPAFGGASNGKAAPTFQMPAGFFPPPGPPVPSARGK